MPSSENRISPDSYFVTELGNSCKMESEVTDFPDPDSPTMATISFLFTENEISLNAFIIPLSVAKFIERFCMLSNEFNIYKTICMDNSLLGRPNTAISQTTHLF